jgi:hypothetical protein
MRATMSPIPVSSGLANNFIDFAHIGHWLKGIAAIREMTMSAASNVL